MAITNSKIFKEGEIVTNEEILSGLNASHFPYSPIPNYSSELSLHYPPTPPFYGGFCVD